MIIHKGEKYTIECKGDVAEKSDGGSLRTMRFYPERDASAIAGEIDEETAWRILHDVATQSLSNKVTPISPYHILMDADNFILPEWSESHDSRFTAPEGYDPVWALGATVFFLFLGCNVFQGIGGKGQSATAPVPVLRRELPDLSNLVASCLDFNPRNRPSLMDIVNVSKVNLERCSGERSEFPPLKPTECSALPLDELDRYWPEEMN